MQNSTGYGHCTTKLLLRPALASPTLWPVASSLPSDSSRLVSSYGGLVVKSMQSKPLEGLPSPSAFVPFPLNQDPLTLLYVCIENLSQIHIALAV